MNFTYSKVIRVTVSILLCLLNQSVIADPPITVSADENGIQQTGHAMVYHDSLGKLTIKDVVAQLQAGEFGPLHSAGSTGLKTGAYWSYFQLHNPLGQALTLHLEYVDHQLIQLDAYARQPERGEYVSIAKLSMESPFSHRLVEHQRFIVPVTFQAYQTKELLVRFDSKESGYTYPSMRIWSPDKLVNHELGETGLMSFLFGGFFLMGVFALVAGLSSGQKLFYTYSLYAFSKIICWATILGYTHQFILRNHFHWSLMSVGGAIAILFGLIFARMFLQTPQYTPRLDKIVLTMIANAVLLLVAAVFQLKPVALITITLALLLYPIVIIAGVIRWRQGVTEAGIFSLAWGFLVLGLLMQALRDLGLIAHTPINYYWPPIASFTEMLTIMVAIGFQMRRLYRDKELVEHKYLAHLEQSKTRLEEEVRIRTQELEQAKLFAEHEARTDPLTGILNRRSFMRDATIRLKLTQRQQQSCCLLMFDLDHFKRINDTCGHSAGDKVLCQFAETIGRNIRETDVFGRLGGEEFALLVGESEQSAYALAERLRADISNIKLPTEDISFVTTSIGLAFADIDTKIGDLLHRADEAMYQAKTEGRNRSIVAQSDKMIRSNLGAV